MPRSRQRCSSPRTEREAAQQEVLELIAGHLQRYFPSARRGCLSRRAAQPLLGAASLLVQEDLVLMRRGEDGWRLAAASLCFPSSWSLEEKFGRPLQDIHTPVPGFGRGTRTADIIHRIFDNLAVEQPVERLNWSLQAGADLYQPLSNVARIDRAQARPSRFPEADVAANAFIRVERQTLRKLPVSGDILFTIRIYLDPMPVLERHAERATLAAVVRRAAGRARHRPARLQGACRRPRPAGRASHGDGGSLDAGADFSFIVTGNCDLARGH